MISSFKKKNNLALKIVKLQQLFKGATPEEQAHQQQEKTIQKQQDQKMAQACNKAR